MSRKLEEKKKIRSSKSVSHGASLDRVAKTELGPQTAFP